MPDITLRNQPFDLAFHPSDPVVYVSLLTGEVKAFRYDDEEGESSTSWTVRPTKRTARALDTNEHLWMGGKSGALLRVPRAIVAGLAECPSQMTLDQGTITAERDEAHETAINRIRCVNENLIATGDDDGVIKFWDPRQPEAVRSYAQHFDYISDFTFFDDKKQLVATSGDGHLSVMDVRSNKSAPLSVSDDQDDELLSITPIKGGSKAVVGTGLGILSVWNRKMGWGDCVDRIPGHPQSVDALVALTPDIVATGSEDGMIRVMQLLPHKFLGVIATHEEYPIERMKLDRNARWLGSVSHDNCLKLTDVQDLFEDSDEEGGGAESDEEEDGDDQGDMEVGEAGGDEDEEAEGHEEVDESGDVEMDSDEESTDKKKKKRGKPIGMGDLGKSTRQNQQNGFFDDL